MSTLRRPAGVTLIELLVAITLAGLVAVVGAAVLRAAIDFHGRAARHLVDSEHLRTADRLLQREWSLRSEQDLVATSSSIEFRSDRLSGIGVEGAARVRYLCSADESGQLTLERQLLAHAHQGAAVTRDGSTAAPAWRVLQTEVLVPRLAACSFAYLRTKEDRDAKIAQWSAETGAGQPAPRLLRLSVATERGEIAPLVYGVDG